MRAGLVVKPGQWPWNSASAHLSGYDDSRVTVIPLLEITEGTWKDFLHAPVGEEEIIRMQRYERTGRTLDSESFVEKLETMLGRILKPQKAGRRAKK